MVTSTAYIKDIGDKEEQGDGLGKCHQEERSGLRYDDLGNSNSCNVEDHVTSHDNHKFTCYPCAIDDSFLTLCNQLSGGQRHGQSYYKAEGIQRD